MDTDQPIILRRDVEATLLPSGTTTILQAGIQTRLAHPVTDGFLIRLTDGLAKVAAKDADALGIEPVSQPQNQVAPAAVAEESIWKQLRTCFDPEIPVNIVDLGLVYDCQVTPLADGTSRVDVKMTLTAPGCSMADSIKYDVEQKILSLPGVCEAMIELVWDPPWHQGMMTEAARLELGLL